MEIQYVNENLAPGHLGYFFVVLSFGAALLSLIAYIFFSRNSTKTSWRNIGRTAFFVHGIGVIGIFTTLFYLIYSHQFQYNYVWAHSSLDLPAHYMISCFWEGQEGSFLLWTFWHFVLGAVLIFKARSWEGPVMTIMALAQVTLASMLLGLDSLSIFGTIVEIPRLGSNPFLLLRKAFPDLPVFSMVNPGTNIVDYVNKIEDGRGLNALLQNYWMVIHPPVLFLGFASTIVPFAFAMGGLWHKRFGEWVRPAMPWMVFSGLFLGTGILMGGAWAYEALSFGGFWAWDPVENGSLVPWIILIAGLHTMMIYRARKTALLSSYIFVTLTFLLILYATFLTRSGVLGDTSVHSFTDLGLSGQLLIFMFAFIIIAIVSLVMRWKSIPTTQKEESTWSREFWMFIGALILSLSALHIISITSIPVFNKLANYFINLLHLNFAQVKLAQPTNIIDTYHQLQIPFAVIIAVLSAIGHYLTYIKTQKNGFFRNVIIAAIIGAMLTAIMAFAVNLSDIRYLILLWAGFFSAAANADVMFTFWRKRNFNLSGAAVAHVGFGLLLAGALVSNAKKETISINTEKFKPFTDASAKEQMENKVLFKDLPVQMSDYKVTFLGDSSDPKHIYFRVNYKRMGKSEEDIKEEFDLYPYVIYNKEKDQFMSTSPSTRHYWHKDIFTHITAASNKNEPEYQVKYDTSFTYQVTKGFGITLDSFDILVADLITEATKNESGQDVYRLTMVVKVNDGMNTYTAQPKFLLDGSQISYEDAEIHTFGLKFSYRMVHPETGKHELVVIKGNRPAPQFITLKAMVFPFINLLWFGCIVMIVGFGIALFRRMKEYKTE
ncbi:MAG: cytochrome c biogenesis protein CcsA [Bacteroidia bacterium]